MDADRKVRVVDCPLCFGKARVLAPPDELSNSYGGDYCDGRDIGQLPNERFITCPLCDGRRLVCRDLSTAFMLLHPHYTRSGANRSPLPVLGDINLLLGAFGDDDD